MNSQAVTAAWQGVDDTLHLLERVRGLLKPLHRDADIAGIAVQIQARRDQPFYVVHAVRTDAAGRPTPVPLPGTGGGVVARLFRPGVFVIDEGADLGLRRHFCDVTPDGIAAPLSAGGIVSPVRCNTIPASSSDMALSAFGAARQAWFAMGEVCRVMAAEVAALDRLIATTGEVIAPDAACGDDRAYLTQLDVLLARQVRVERERLRYRDELQRNFTLRARELASRIGPGQIETKNRESEIDRFRPRWMRGIIGRSQVDWLLRDDAINTLVSATRREAFQAAEDRIRGLANRIGKLGTAQLERHLGRNEHQWLLVGEPPRHSADTSHEVIATAGRGFRVTVERLGVIDRVMKARVDISGLFALLFLGISAFKVLQDHKNSLTFLTLWAAIAVAAVTCLTSSIAEAERRVEELERLREKLAKTSAEAAATLYAAILSEAVDRLEDMRTEVKARLDAHPAQQPPHPSAAPPGIQSVLVGLRADIMREMQDDKGPVALGRRLAQLIGPGAALRMMKP